MVLVVAMVLSISAEIFLNAGVQPIASSLIARLTEGDETDSEGSGFLLRTLEGTVAAVSRLSSPINTASQTLLVWIGILGGSLAYRRRAHLGVDALVRCYPPKVRLFLDYLSTVLVGLFSIAVFTVGGYLVCERAFSTGSKMPGFETFNRGWFYSVLLIAGVSNLLYCIHHFRNPVPVGTEPTETEDSESP